MGLTVAVILLLLVVGLILWRKKKRTQERRAAADKTSELANTARYHAVSIRAGRGACQAAIGLEGQRFLSDAAPAIPLPRCDARQCRCRFVHFDDRRSGDERRSPFPPTIGLDTGAYRREQRKSEDRRKNSDGDR